MKRFSPQNIFAAIAAFITVLFLAENGGAAGSGKTKEEEE
jgi:hypothetical protein